VAAEMIPSEARTEPLSVSTMSVSAAFSMLRAIFFTSSKDWAICLRVSGLASKYGASGMLGSSLELSFTKLITRFFDRESHSFLSDDALFVAIVGAIP